MFRRIVFTQVRPGVSQQRSPPGCSPPRWVSSTCTVPPSRQRWSRSRMACMGLCLGIQAVLSLTPSLRLSSRAEMAFLVWDSR